ncbi:MAG: hypothetical protein QM723_05730 [Myxococcaceae bacterium]
MTLLVGHRHHQQATLQLQHHVVAGLGAGRGAAFFALRLQQQHARGHAVELEVAAGVGTGLHRLAGPGAGAQPDVNARRRRIDPARERRAGGDVDLPRLTFAGLLERPRLGGERGVAHLHEVLADWHVGEVEGAERSAGGHARHRLRARVDRGHHRAHQRLAGALHVTVDPERFACFEHQPGAVLTCRDAQHRPMHRGAVGQ